MSNSIQDTTFDSIEQAIEDIKAGKMVIVVDDEDRENEGILYVLPRRQRPISSILWLNMVGG